MNRQNTQGVCPWNSPRLVPITAEEDYRPRPPVEVEGRSPSALRASASPRSGRSRSRVVDAADSSRAAEASSAPQGPNHLPGMAAPSLVELMRMTRNEWDHWTRGSAIRRAGYAGLKRNVAVAIGNWLASVADPPAEAVAVLREALDDEELLVRAHVAWALPEIERA